MSAIDRRLRSGAWIKVAPGVYALPSHPGTWHRQAWIAALAHPGGAIGLEAAAAIRGFEGFSQGPLELVLPSGANNRSSVATIHRYDGALVDRFRGLPVTTAAQTFADLCGRPFTGRIEPALDRELLAGRVTQAQLEERVRFYADTRRRGHPLFEALVRERGPEAWRPSESALEDSLRRMVRRLRLREVVWQPRLPWRTTTGERLDALLPESNVILEADGRAWHARLHDFDADRWRDNEAVANGLVVLRFTWVHLTHRFEDCLALTTNVVTGRRRAA